MTIWSDIARNKKIEGYSLNKMMCVVDGSGLLKVSSLITIKRSSGSFIWVYTVLDSARDPARPSTARPVQPKNRSRFCETNNFFISALNEMKFCTLLNKSLDHTFFQVTKMQKLSSNIFLYIPKTFGVDTSKNWSESCILDISYTRFLSVTLHNSIFTKHVYLQ